MSVGEQELFVFVKAGAHRDRLQDDTARPARGALLALMGAVVLLVGAGLMLRTLFALNAVDPGFDSERVLTLQASIHPRSFAEFEKKWQF